MNWHLIFVPEPVLEYAMTHEFSHLACCYSAYDRLDRVGL